MKRAFILGLLGVNIHVVNAQKDGDYSDYDWGDKDSGDYDDYDWSDYEDYDYGDYDSGDKDSGDYGDYDEDDWGDKDSGDYDEDDWGDKDSKDSYSQELEPMEKQTLPSLNVDPDTITIFGYSCGSWTAHQIGTIFSETIKGQTLCNGGLSFGWETVDIATTRIDEYSADSKVQPTSNLVDYPVYIFSGINDEVIPPSFQQQQKDFYDYYSADTTLVTVDVGHYFESDTFRNGLEWSYSNIMGSNWSGLSEDEDDWQSNGVLIPIDQDEFAPQPVDRSFSGIAERGFLYYPNACIGDDKSCKLAIVLTGGSGNTTETMSSGFLQVAAGNDMVVLFPQQDIEHHACFDLEGYTGDDYDTLSGVQSLFFKAMIDRLIQPQDASSYDYSITGTRFCSDEDACDGENAESVSSGEVDGEYDSQQVILIIVVIVLSLVIVGILAYVCYNKNSQKRLKADIVPHTELRQETDISASDVNFSKQATRSHKSQSQK